MRIENVSHRTEAVQKYPKHIFKLLLECKGHYHPRCYGDGVVPEKMVDSYTCSCVSCDIVSHPVSSIPLVAVACLSHVVRQLGLEKVQRAILAIPHQTIFEVVLGCNAKPSHVIAIDDHAILGRVATAVHEAIDVVVCPPQPGVVDHHIVRIDREQHVRLHFRGGCRRIRTADSTKDVAKNARVGSVSSIASMIAPSQQRRSFGVSSLQQKASNSCPRCFGRHCNHCIALA